MFDTHCHLNFKAFAGRVKEVITNANKAGITSIVIPGTDIESSIKAVNIAEKHDGVYAAVGIHPHHVFQINQRAENGKNQSSEFSRLSSDLSEIEKLITNSKVVAIGEVGVDRHYYNKTKYPNYQIDESFMDLQKEFLRQQIELAVKNKKSIIFHNREAKKDFLKMLTDYRSLITDNRCVFHCCEPDQELLDFATRFKIFIGVDGDVTYRKDKEEFIKKVPLELLVLETDSPFLLPRPRQDFGRQAIQLKFPNEPENLQLIANFIAETIGINFEELANITEENSRKLFQIY